MTDSETIPLSPRRNSKTSKQGNVADSDIVIENPENPVNIDEDKMPPATTEYTYPPQEPGKDVADNLEILTPARTAYGEARGEGDKGMTAVLCVIMNRTRRAQRHFHKYGRPHVLFGNGTFADCCKRPQQFSCWNPGDPNLAAIEQADTRDEAFCYALSAAGEMTQGALIDITDGATHYHAKSMAEPPYWAKGKIPCAEIGGHLFYNDIN